MAKPSKYAYHPAATVRDELDGSVYTLGSTTETMSIEISGNTHPFYTGQETLVDTAGRIDKFKTRLALATSGEKKAKTRDSKGKQKQNLADMLKEDAKPTVVPVKKLAPKKAVTPVDIQEVEQTPSESVPTPEVDVEQK